MRDLYPFPLTVAGSPLRCICLVNHDLSMLNSFHRGQLRHHHSFCLSWYTARLQSLSFSILLYLLFVSSLLLLLTIRVVCLGWCTCLFPVSTWHFAIIYFLNHGSGRSSEGAVNVD
jgi:hypothetical protein